MRREGGGQIPDTASARANRLLQLLADATGVLARTRRMSEILDRVVALTFESVAAGRVFLLLVDEHSGELVPRIARTRGGISPGQVNISRTVLGAVMRDKTSMLSTDVPQDRRVDTSASLVLQRVRSFMCAPLWTEHDVFGVLYVDAPEEKSFSESDLDLFTTVSNYAAVAIEQARLAARLLEETRRRERLQRYHSPAVAERIVKQQEGEADAMLEAQERDVTVLFADLVGFTTWSERMPPVRDRRDAERVLHRDDDGDLPVRGHAGQVHRRRRARGLRRPARPARSRDACRERRLCHARGADPLERIAVRSRSGCAWLSTPGLRSSGTSAPRCAASSRCSATSSTRPPAYRARSASPIRILITGETYQRLGGLIEARALGSVKVKGRTAPVAVYEI